MKELNPYYRQRGSLGSVWFREHTHTRVVLTLGR